ncbi:P27 family phage terminase small subunit [Priestia flexa]|uniref:P27 family phage terminase small subunit n=1 Tax=Priestia flexa TaxID=86664 RepID=UPI001F4C55A3|nr:P27 family phage terminase small subunit [Priestia flexa]
MAVSISDLKAQLMRQIDVNDLVQVEKVERYVSLVESFRNADETIKREGESITTENGSQRFTKAHPLIGERNKINSSLIALGKDIDSYRVSDQPSRESNDYDNSDLV